MRIRAFWGNSLTFSLALLSGPMAETPWGRFLLFMTKVCRKIMGKLSLSHTRFCGKLIVVKSKSAASPAALG